MSDGYEQFIIQIKKKTGIDLSFYKEVQMKRRLKSLYEKKGFSSFQDFFKEINKSQNLFNELLDRLTINVSEFFRNYKRWEVLESKILPQILKNNKHPKIWSAACSTGEEAYTIAMIVSCLTGHTDLRILATDIDENALVRAKAGVYSKKSVNEVPERLKQRYFNQHGDFYYISNEIKEMVTFKKHNLLVGPYDCPYDPIICRNVLIYFTEEAKNQLYQKFSSALKKDGILFVGSTEQIFNPGLYHFKTEETFFYQKI